MASTLALLATGLVTSSYASATTNWVICFKLENNEGTYKNAKCTEPGKGKYLKEELLENEYVNFEGEGGPSKLEGEFTIECKKDSSFGDLGGGAELFGTITFAECKIPGHTECTVSKDKFEVNGKVVFIEGEMAEFALKLEPGSEVTISGSSCTYTGKLKIKGKETCWMPKILTLKLTNTIECKPEGSEIEVIGEGEAKWKSLKFTDTEKVKLATGTEGDYWGL